MGHPHNEVDSTHRSENRVDTMDILKSDKRCYLDSYSANSAQECIVSVGANQRYNHRAEVDPLVPPKALPSSDGEGHSIRQSCTLGQHTVFVEDPACS